jgi:K+-transporting ATPase ATPase C chain
MVNGELKPCGFTHLQHSANFMKNFINAILFTISTTILFGLIYPLTVTALAQLIFPHQANGSLIKNERGENVGSELIGQKFESKRYFHSRPSAADYNAGASSGSNLAPTNAKLIARIKADVEKYQSENPNAKVPVDLVTTSASGLDPHISPAAAEFQIPRIAKERGASEEQIRRLVKEFTQNRQFGFFGEPHVNVLVLNLKLDEMSKK